MQSRWLKIGAGLGVLAGIGTSDCLTSVPAQAAEEVLLMAAKTTSLYDFAMNDIDGKPVNLQSVPRQDPAAGQYGQFLREYPAIF